MAAFVSIDLLVELVRYTIYYGRQSTLDVFQSNGGTKNWQKRQFVCQLTIFKKLIYIGFGTFSMCDH